MHSLAVDPWPTRTLQLAPATREKNGGWRLLGFLSERTGLPGEEREFRILRSGGVAAVAMRESEWQPGRLPSALSGTAGFVGVSPPPLFARTSDIQAAMERSATRLTHLLADYQGCVEIRVALLRRAGGPSAGGETSRREARVVLGFAESLTELSRRACITPKGLRPASGKSEVCMALSLLVSYDRHAAILDALALSRRLADTEGLDLLATPPGPVLSFPVTGWCSPDQWLS